MHKRLILGLLTAAAILAPGAATARAQAPIQHSIYQNYIDPFAADGWEPARTDMGVDWFVTRPLPVLAIGDAVILGSNSHDAGWPGHHFIWYQLLAEALPGGTGTEWGWAQADGATRANDCYHEGQQTHSGKEMARFMQSLGAEVAERPGPGIDAPFGKLC
jgi:hypothetical protein